MPRRQPVRRLPAPGPPPRPLSPPGTITCKGCGRSFVRARFERHLRVCPECGHHGVVDARVRAEQLADKGALQVLEHAPSARDPLEFDDGVPYPERLVEARKKTGLHEVFVVGRATLDTHPVVLACMDFAFMGGSLGSAAGELFAYACDTAVSERRALIAVCTSGGARMQEGIVSLAQMARCTAAVSSVSQARLPYVSILTDPCFGGVTASFAVQADVILAEPGARIGFAGARVIELASHERLPDGFQTAEFLAAHGLVDAVVHRAGLRDALSRLLSPYMGHTLASG